jgi:hypothetical protein
MLWLSAALVAATLGWMSWQLGGDPSQLRPGFEQMIHARLPWGVLGALGIAAALTAVSLMLRRRWYGWLLLGLELLLLGTLTHYFVRGSVLPPSHLKLQAGDAFPSYALEDQDRKLHERISGEPGQAALYIFYRGDW